MSTSSRSLMIVLAVMALSPVPAAAQEPLPAMEAEIETTYATPAGPRTVAGRYYRSQDGKIREDSPIGAIITDTKSGTVTLLTRATKEARVLKASEQPRPAAPAGAATSFEEFGQATIEGHAVTKSRATTRDGRTQELWTAKDLGLAVYSKVNGENFTMTKVLRKFSLRAPDPSVFEIPSDYKVTDDVRPLTPPSPVGPRVSPRQ